MYQSFSIELHICLLIYGFDFIMLHVFRVPDPLFYFISRNILKLYANFLFTFFKFLYGVDIIMLLVLRVVIHYYICVNMFSTCMLRITLQFVISVFIIVIMCELNKGMVNITSFVFVILGQQVTISV